MTMSDSHDDQDTRSDEYLAQAAEARQNAERASCPQARARWENTASVWEYIAKLALPDPSVR